MKLLNSKKGVTVLEGVIALGLLAVVAAGAFGVLLSAARKSTQPDMREEMALAVEKAKDKLQVYIGTDYDSNAKNHLPSGLAGGLCGGDSSPLSSGQHNIKCMLPLICDAGSADSAFYYEVGGGASAFSAASATLDHYKHQEGGTDRVARLCNNCASLAPSSMNTLGIKFTIKCNGYEL